MVVDVSKFYLLTPLTWPEFVRIYLWDILEEITQEYKLKSLATENGAIYIYVDKGIYKLPQDGLLANKLLEKWHKECGYHHSKLVPGLW